MISFKEVWAKSIWPVVRAKYEQLLKERPAEQGLGEDSASGGHYGKKVLAKAVEQGEVRNISCNLCWSDPLANTPMQENISYDNVANWAVDTYTDVTAVQPLMQSLSGCFQPSITRMTYYWYSDDEDEQDDQDDTPTPTSTPSTSSGSPSSMPGLETPRLLLLHQKSADFFDSITTDPFRLQKAEWRRAARKSRGSCPGRIEGRHREAT